MLRRCTFTDGPQEGDQVREEEGHRAYDEERQRAYDEERQRVKGDLEAVQDEVGNLPQVAQDIRSDLQKRVGAACQSILGALETIPRAPDQEQKRLAAQAVSAIAMIEADIAAVVMSADDDGQNGDCEGTELVDGDTIANGRSQLSRRFFRRIQPKMLSVTRRVWNMLSKYLSLQSWSIGGEISAGIPALAMGKVTVTLTFGP